MDSINKICIAIQTHGENTLSITIESLRKHVSKNMDIWLMNACRPEEEDGREEILRVSQEYINVNIFQPPTRIQGDPILFDIILDALCEELTGYDWIYKVDADMVFTMPVLDSLFEAYNLIDDIAFACPIYAIQHGMIELFAKRIGLELDPVYYHNDYPLLFPKLYRTSTIAPTLNANSDAEPYAACMLFDNEAERTKELWDAITPPDKIISKLREGERYVILDNNKLGTWWACNNFLIERKKILQLREYGKGIEPRLNNYRIAEDKKIAIDTHSFVYHLSWGGQKDYYNKYIHPELLNMDFWKLETAKMRS